MLGAWLLSFQMLFQMVLQIALMQPLDACAAASSNGENSPARQLSTTTRPAPETDRQIRQHINAVFSQIESLADVEVSVRDGVVTLSGTTPNDSQARRAEALAGGTDGVVTVENKIESTLDLQSNVTPLLQGIQADLNRWIRALPLLLLSLLVFLTIGFAGHRLSKWTSLWNRVAPNPFLAELLGQGVRAAAIVFGAVIALNLVGATALIGTILGGAGVLGLAIGFAVKDSLENYVSSIMLSLRQPFRANDHVLINTHEGKVVRLTSRATVLMTLDGNHLRIPNSTVFKAVIVNYTRNPERRFEFKLGVDAADDPIAAMTTGLGAIRALEFVLGEPKPNANIDTVGDSNIVLSFMAWVDQRHTDFAKARSLAIRAAKLVLEERGFTLPEPIYRLKFDAPGGGAAEEASAAGVAAEKRKSNKRSVAADVQPSDAVLDVRPDTHLAEKVDEERAQDRGADLLDSAKPIE